MLLVLPPSLRLWLFTDAFPGSEAGRQWEHHQRILSLQANVQVSSGKLSLEETVQDRSKLVGLDGEKVLRRRDTGKSRADWWPSSPLELQNFPAQTQSLNMPCRRENGVRATALPGALHGSELFEPELSGSVSYPEWKGWWKAPPSIKMSPLSGRQVLTVSRSSWSLRRETPVQAPLTLGNDGQHSPS